jgi:hypothetical protein
MMYNVIIVALPRQHSDLELQMLNGHGAAVATERDLEATVWRLAAHSQALNTVLQRARARVPLGTMKSWIRRSLLQLHSSHKRDG